jgi:hypothetical protein
VRPFLVRDKAKTNESLYSYLFRIFEENCVSVMDTFIYGKGYRINNYLEPSSYERIREFLASRLFTTPDNLILNQYDELLFSFKNKNHRLNSVAYEQQHTKYCPECLNEDFYHRLYWDVSFLTICTKHQRFLINKCVSCGEFIKLNSLMNNKCKCGNQYTFISSSAERPLAGLLNSQQEIKELLLGQKTSCFINNTYITSLEFFTLYFLCGRFINNFSTHNPLMLDANLAEEKISFERTKGKTTDLKLLSFMVNAVHQLITNPSEKLPLALNYIDNILYKKSTSNTASKYKILKEICSLPNGDIYHDAYTRYFNELEGEYSRTRTALKPKVYENKFVTGGEAMKELKIKKKKLLQFGDSGLLKVHLSNKRGRNITLVEKTSIEEFNNLKENIMNLKEVCSFLGIHHAVAHQLSEAKIISLIPGLPYFWKSEVEFFLQSVKDEAVVIEQDGPDWITISKALMRNGNDVNTRYADIITLILEKKIRVAFIQEKKNLKGLVVSKSDVGNYKFQKHIERISTNGFTPEEIRKIIGVRVEKVLQFIEDKTFLVTSCRKNSNGTVTQYVSKDQVVTYLIEYKCWTKKQAEECFTLVIQKRK